MVIKPLLLLPLLLLLMATADASNPVSLKTGICSNPTCSAMFGVAPTTIRVTVYVKADGGADKLTYGVDCNDAVVGESKVDVRANPAPMYVREFRVEDEDAGLCIGWARITFVGAGERLLKSQDIRVDSVRR